MRAAVSTVWVVVAAAAAGGCGDNHERTPVVMTAGDLEVRVWEEPAQIEVLKDGAIVWASLPGLHRDGDAPAVFAANRTTHAAVEFQFGSFKFDPDDDTPWAGVSSLKVTEIQADRVSFELQGHLAETIGNGSVALTADGAAGGGGELTISLGFTGSPDRASIAFACAPGEHFLGLGSQSFNIDHHGQDVPLWVQEDGIGRLDLDDDNYFGVWALTGRRHSTHTAIPIMLSSRGWALALNTLRRSDFDLCKHDDKVARLEAWGDSLELHLFLGATPADSIARMTTWVGRPAIPPAFTFAPWLDAIFGETNVTRVADKLRAEDIATSVIWTEDWRGGVDEGITGTYSLEENWRVDRNLYPTIEALSGHLHDSGYKFLTYQNTFIDSEADIRAEAVALGHTIKKADGTVYDFIGNKFRDESLLDLSSPAAVAWARDIWDDVIPLGADGWMADFGEWLPPDAVLASGEDALAVHNRYTVEWSKINESILADAYAQDGVERVFFMRSGGLGSQAHTPVIWPGDQQTDFTVGDGFPAVIPEGIGLGIAGFPYYAHDIGGYMSQTTVPTTKELWFRWVTLGALTPVMRTHHGRSARQNWNWESDTESTAHMRRWTKLHMQLVPYLRSLAEVAHATGAPMFRPFALDDPPWEPGWTMTDEYLLGDRIAVAPVVIEGATSRDVLLPPGRWYGMFDGARVDSDGAAAIVAAAPVTEIPAYVADCTVIAAYPPEVDTVVAAQPAAGLVTAADVGDDRELWVYPCAGTPGAAARMTETGGVLSYARGGAAFAAAGATWNGQAVTFVVSNGWATADVVGPGVLAVGGAEVVRADGGSATRKIRLRIVVP